MILENTDQLNIQQNIQYFWGQPENVSWGEENQSIDQFMIFNTQIMEVIIKNKNNRLFCKTTEYSVLFILFCTSTGEKVSFVA